MSVINMPEKKLPEFLVGPFEEWRVVIDGRVIPRLTGWREGTRVWLSLDHRFGLECENEQMAYRTASFVAEALAIGAGYSHAGADSKEHPFAARTATLPTEAP